MKAVIFSKPFEIQSANLERPEPKEGEALIQVGAAGVCAGDVYIYQGIHPYVSYPIVGGHEIAGRIVKFGPDTDGPAIGTAVAVEPFIGCGRCYACRIGKSNCCHDLHIIGVHRNGGFAEYLTAPVDRLHPMPKGLSFFKAAFAEPVAIGVQTCKRGMVNDADTVLVLGAGPIGLAIVEVARARGAKVLIADINENRLATAAELGAITILAGEGLLEEVMRQTNGEGMPVVIEATGNHQVAESTVDLVASGGRVVIVGIYKNGVRVGFPGLDLVRKEMTIIGSRASVASFPESLDLIARGTIRYPEIATKFDLGEAAAVFDRIVGGKPLHKAVFVEPA